MKERERAVMTVTLITELFASCAEAARLTHDADSPSPGAKVTELTHSDTLRFIQPAATHGITGTLSLRQPSTVRLLIWHNLLSSLKSQNWSHHRFLFTQSEQQVSGEKRHLKLDTEAAVVVV